jgi:TRAP-type C4-dicarboxylate transport system permease small subunit
MSQQDRTPDLADRLIRRIVGAGGTIAAVLIIAMTVLVSVNVAFRSLPGVKSLTFVEEYTGYLFVGIAFLGFADAFFAGAHVRVSFFLSQMQGRKRSLYEVPLVLVSIAVTVVVGWFGMRHFLNAWSHNELAQTVSQTPLWIPRLAVPVGCAILLLALLSHLRAALRGGIRNDPEVLTDD